MGATCPVMTGAKAWTLLVAMSAARSKVVDRRNMMGEFVTKSMSLDVATKQ